MKIFRELLAPLQVIRTSGLVSARFASTANGGASATTPASATPSTASPATPPKTPASSPSSRPVNYSSDMYDVFIVGGGITGTALYYVLAAFTDARRVGICERRKEFAVVASHGRNNSQTIHCGDIETNYTLAKATAVKRHADILRNYGCNLPDNIRDKCIFKMSKMALAVGEKEMEFMHDRYNTFKGVFPNMKYLEKAQIADVEPRIAMMNTYTFREDPISAIYVNNEHTGVDYFELAKAFATQAEALAAKKQNTKFDTRMNTEVLKINKENDGTYTIQTNNVTIKSRYVVVSACGHSLLLAHRLGYGLQYSCLPVAGSFYFANKRVLNGKAYTVQNPKLPFAAVHGDPDVITQGLTRFGPTALPLPMLERYNNSTIKDFLEVLKPDAGLLAVYWDLFKVSTIRNYILRNFLFEVPIINKELFAKDVRKIIPSLKAEDLSYAKGFGGVRPQLVDKINKKLILGEGRIAPDENIVFNITPSPGGTTCLGTAELDAVNIAKRIGLNFDRKAFDKTLVDGPYK